MGFKDWPYWKKAILFGIILFILLTTYLYSTDGFYMVGFGFIIIPIFFILISALFGSIIDLFKNKNKKPFFNLLKIFFVFLLISGFIVYADLVHLFGPKLFPDRCNLLTYLPCVDFRVEKDFVRVVLRNDEGQDINITEIVIGERKIENVGILKNGEQKTYTISGYNNSVGKPFYGELEITYYNVRSGYLYSHTANGKIYTAKVKK